jgi:hypothetical protein
LLYSWTINSKNLSKAIGLFQKGIVMRSIKLIFNLSYCYQTGKGVGKNLPNVIQLY